ncbi:MAG: hypothetical protein ABIN89_15630 [Chitinophagaceae bacterium]
MSDHKIFQDEKGTCVKAKLPLKLSESNGIIKLAITDLSFVAASN